jgi:putative flippase GtrA
MAETPTEAPLFASVAKPRWTLRRLLRWVWESWATRSMAVGGVGALLDIGVLLVCVHAFGLPNPLGAMVGVAVGCTFAFFANRHFAFRDHTPEIAPQALKYALSTAGAMLIHASLVWLLADRWGLPVVLAKVIADFLVFTVGQLLVMRYVVFPKRKDLPGRTDLTPAPATPTRTDTLPPPARTR